MGQGAGRPADVLRAADHLPGNAVSRSMALSLRAWLAGRGGDIEAERADLEALLAVQPADDAALERLADLAAKAGEPQRVADLRRRKAAVDAAFERYRALINEPELTPHAADLARAAEAICRWFDSRQWWRLAARQDASLAVRGAAALARLARVEASAESDGRSLVDLLRPARPAQDALGPGPRRSRYPHVR